MVTLFERIATRRSEGRREEQPSADAGQAGSRIGIAIASYPADADRMRYFREAAAR